MMWRALHCDPYFDAPFPVGNNNNPALYTPDSTADENGLCGCVPGADPNQDNGSEGSILKMQTAHMHSR